MEFDLMPLDDRIRNADVVVVYLAPDDPYEPTEVCLIGYELLTAWFASGRRTPRPRIFRVIAKSDAELVMVIGAVERRWGTSDWQETDWLG